MARESNDVDPTNLNIPESKIMHEVEGSGISIGQFLKMLKIKKVNIGFLKNTNFANIGGYWDEETLAKITVLLHEFQHLFSADFAEMKGIVGYLRKMKTLLKSYAKPSKQRPYMMNSWYK